MAETLKKSVDSILSLIDDRFEIVIVDDGSEKNCINKIKYDFMDIDKRVRFLFLERDVDRNLGEVRNIAARHANGQWILNQFDADDVYYRDFNWFIDLFHKIQKNISHPIYLKGDKLNIVEKYFFIKTGGYKNLKRGEDRELWQRLAKYNSIIFISHKKVYKRLNRGSHPFRSLKNMFNEQVNHFEYHGTPRDFLFSQSYPYRIKLSINGRIEFDQHSRKQEVVHTLIKYFIFVLSSSYYYIRSINNNNDHAMTMADYRRYRDQFTLKLPVDKVPKINEKLAILVHIPKCAGKSFKSSLLKKYGSCFVDFSRDRTSFDIGQKYRHIKWKVLSTVFEVEVPKDIKIVSGHFSADTFRHYVNIKRGILIRHPYTWIVSYYKYMRAKRPDINFGSVSDFVQKNKLQEAYMYYLGHWDIEQLDFILLQEEYARSILLFNRVFSADLDNIHINKTIDIDSSYENDLIDENIKALMKDNVLIYEKICKRFNNICNFYGV